MADTWTACGGLSVIVCGDLWQLDPPGGTPLATIPSSFVREAREYAPAPDVEHGYHLLWGQAQNCIQGVTELTECVGCVDLWFLEVQKEMRDGAMTEDPRATVPGTYMKEDAACCCWQGCS